MYRALCNLDKDGKIIYKGSVFTGKNFMPETLNLLVQLNKIAVVMSPPLSEFPSWKSRAKKLTAAGIITIDQFIDMDDVELAKILGRPVFIVKQWKSDLEGYLQVPKPEER